MTTLRKIVRNGLIFIVVALPIVWVVITVGGVVAHSQGTAYQGLLRQTPTFTLPGCDGASINAGVNCEIRTRELSPHILGVEGHNVLTLEVAVAYAAGTNISWTFQACNEGLRDSDCTDAADWFPVQSLSVTPAGAGTVSTLTLTKTTGAATRFTYSLGLNYVRLRLAGIIAGGTPTANDKVTVKARLGVVPAI
jgi:hypothetical protein